MYQKSLTLQPIGENVAIPGKKVSVQSRILRSMGYDDKSKILEIDFQTGLVYQYWGGPPKGYADLMHSEGIGKYFSEKVRPKFAAEQVGVKIASACPRCGSMTGNRRIKHRMPPGSQRSPDAGNLIAAIVMIGCELLCMLNSPEPGFSRNRAHHLKREEHFSGFVVYIIHSTAKTRKGGDSG